MTIQENTLLSSHTVYKIGGPADFFVEAKNADDLEGAVFFAKERNIPFFILGAGSNVLVADNGFRGLVIHSAGGEIKVEGEKVFVDAGVMMARAVSEAARARLTGFEWGIGVPGTIGGSVRGNAGCFGGEIKDIVESVEVFDSIETKSRKLGDESCRFGYRDSAFKKHPEWIILSAVLRLRKGDSEKIQARIREITIQRTQKQDIGTKSCGCIFKNVPWSRKDIDKKAILRRFPDMPSSGTVDGIPVSYLIDKAGLRGKKIGRVFVSPKHANYFVNEGGASAEEVVMLIGTVKDAVKRKFGILLEEEIQYVGF